MKKTWRQKKKTIPGRGIVFLQAVEKLSATFHFAPGRTLFAGGGLSLLARWRSLRGLRTRPIPAEVAAFRCIPLCFITFCDSLKPVIVLESFLLFIPALQIWSQPAEKTVLLLQRCAFRRKDLERLRLGARPRLKTYAPAALRASSQSLGLTNLGQCLHSWLAEYRLRENHQYKFQLFHQSEKNNS
ncbi:hypothetical protein [Planococcus shenhongbingii]|nr:hypothetical protein [Planococcus sp. N017]